MPWPASVSVQPGQVAIDGSFSISVSGEGAGDARVQAAARRLYLRLNRQTGVPMLPQVLSGDTAAAMSITVENKDHPEPQKLGDDESYTLEISGGHVRLSATNPLGVLRGAETFLQLVRQNNPRQGTPPVVGFSVPEVTIRDQPRFPWRGLSLDVSRHFIPVEGVKRTLAGMAAVKLNVLHWHLSDDQGFRIESKKFPKLQRLGSDTFFYTQDEVKDVIKYARELGIRVVPEFDMPGHATSWLVGYPQLASGEGPYQIIREPGIARGVLDPTRESTYRFLSGFISEMAKLFPDEYFHIGGDEVDPKDWNQNKKIRAYMAKKQLADEHALQAYFNQRLLKMVTHNHKHMEGWDEILHPDLPKSILIQSWRGQKSLADAAQKGYGGILSAGYYLDLMHSAAEHYAIDPLKAPPVQPTDDPARATRRQQEHQQLEAQLAQLTNEEKGRILGGEAAMWVELATSEDLDTKLWPRLAAIAERFWSPESTTDVASMYRRLAVTDHWLEWLGLAQHTNLILMRQRLAGTMPIAPLDKFVSVLEPIRNYSRQKYYSSLTPLNKLVDSIPPESDAAREFSLAVDHYLQNKTDAKAASAISKQLSDWQQSAIDIRPMLEANSILTDVLSTAETMQKLCEVGKQAVAALSAGGMLESGWHDDARKIVADASKPQAEMFDQLAPAIAKLVAATENSPAR